MMKVRLEYDAIDCIKANSKGNRKIFKIFKTLLDVNEKISKKAIICRCKRKETLS